MTLQALRSSGAARAGADAAVGGGTTATTVAEATAPPSPALDQPAPDQPAPVLQVHDLSVAYGARRVVSGVDLTLRRGTSLALIGESGSGKSTIARSVLRLLPRGASTPQGRIEVDGRDLLALSDRAFRPLRGRTLAFVPQDPASSLNPVRRIGAQAQEAAALLGERDAGRRRELALEAFADVGLPDPERVYDAYPHQLSGGMLQRVLIALAVLPQPRVLVADEPTSALDVTVQRRILDLLEELRRTRELSLLLITHDLALAAERAEEIVVLRDGRVQEAGPARQVLHAPTSDYARALRADVPALNPDRLRELRASLEVRDAVVPAPEDRPDQAAPDGEHRSSGDVASAAAWASTARAATPRIAFEGVHRTFGGGAAGRAGVVAAEDVTFTVAPGTTHALVGESGSGKTTAVRMLLGLERPDAGRILVDGEPVPTSPRALRGLRRHLQLVYQNPFTSLDPTWRVGRLVCEPLDRFGVGRRSERADLVVAALDDVGLGAAFLARSPHELSGGQRQRVAIARALVTRPDTVVLDEPTSALDVSVQADILDVLVRLQAEHGLTYLFVSHDLGLVRQLADTVTVLRNGRVVEQSSAADLFAGPREAYTRALLAAVPRAEELA
ncbi:ABC transporter ATP-binding protein [Miniimonas arenae]|uniref:ABC transporter ATP-binding protein n=1 Tax=Miniimonas arenae TaxID=676201 RepID=A0A5C5BCD7_9MICO|nr:ABC transporter ATP-binding protein [Miniimonas arenae]TNU74890.1 ABC transporter ATP-binding protein [Miniimonas arenae]